MFNAPPARRAAAAVPPAPGTPAEAWCEADWRADVILGLPVALRLSRRLGESRAWVEGGAAVYVVIPSVFAGLRFDGVLHRSAADGLMLRPGVDAYYVPIYGRDWLFGDYRHGLGVVALDFECVWHHKWSERFAGSVGTKFGCGVGWTHRSVFPVPVLGVTMGLEF